MAVWQNNKLVVIGLSVLLAAQFAISIRPTMGIKAVYDEHFGCWPVKVEIDVFASFFMTTMAVDFVILLLTVYKTYNEYKSMYRSGLIKLIFRDGLAYFAVV